MDIKTEKLMVENLTTNDRRRIFESDKEAPEQNEKKRIRKRPHNRTT